jgi:hypothetical protein
MTAKTIAITTFSTARAFRRKCPAGGVLTGYVVMMLPA